MQIFFVEVLKINRLNGLIIICLLAMLLLAAFTGPAVSVSAQDQGAVPLKWEVVDKPGKAGNLIVSPSEINRLAIGTDNTTENEVIYAVDTANSRLYRSNNGGQTFDNITQSIIDAGSTLPLHEIGVAPDQPKYVAVSDNISRVYFSSDSGKNWIDTKVDSQTGFTGIVQCISISGWYPGGGTDSYHDIAVGSAVWGDNITTGQIWTSKIGKSFSSWQNQNLTIGGSPGAEVSAIAFSSTYYADPTILAVASTGNDAASDNNSTFLCIGQRDLSSQTTLWNGIVNYPVKIDAAGDAFGESVSSSIALPSDYSGSISTTRKVFVSYNRQPDAADGVYRFDDVTRDKFVGSSENISSIAYYGTLTSGKLLAGGSDNITLNSVQVWRTLSPLGTPIGTLNTTQLQAAYQPPSGPGNARVAWSYDGIIAFCGTGQVPGVPLDESAFSQSPDNGDTWDQTSLINTDKNLHVSDIAPAPDSKSLFMATFSPFAPEGIWRTAGEPLGKYWGRIYSMRTLSNQVLLRLSPDYRNDYTIYAVEAASDNQTNYRQTMLIVSEDRGNHWQKRFVPGPVIDMIAAGKHTLYIALPGGYVRKSEDAGITWGDEVLTGLTGINMLALADNGHIFAGSRDSKVAYSTDNGTSFIEIIDPIGTNTGFVQVAADADYSSNNIIYAADNITDKGVWRWTIGRSTQWKQMDEAITMWNSGQIISGLMTGPEGTLYALRAERPKPYNRTVNPADNYTGTGGMNRTLNPTEEFLINIEWDDVNRTLTDNQTAFAPGPLSFINNPPWLKLSGNAEENMLWAIDTFPASDNTTQIWRFRDNLCKIGPWTDSPKEIGCDPVSGRNQQVDLAWEQLSLTDRYQLQLAKDRDFTLKINPAILAGGIVSAVTGAILINTDEVNVTSPAAWLAPASLPEAGAFYYWRIRCFHAATWEFIRSPWSVTARFLVKPGFPVTTPYYGPQLLSPQDGCGCPCNAPVSFSWSPYKEAIKYKFELSDNADMSRPLVSANLNTTAYQYNGRLECSRNYFWRVMEMEPVPGDWSATFSFQLDPSIPVQTPVERTASAPLWAWIGIAAGSVTAFVLFVLLLRQLRTR